MKCMCKGTFPLEKNLKEQQNENSLSRLRHVSHAAQTSRATGGGVWWGGSARLEPTIFPYIRITACHPRTIPVQLDHARHDGALGFVSPLSNQAVAPPASTRYCFAQSHLWRIARWCPRGGCLNPSCGCTRQHRMSGERVCARFLSFLA